VANFKEVDPELGPLNLSKGGVYPIEFALRLGAGFGSQISMTLLRWVTAKDAVRPGPNALGYEYRIEDANTWKAWLNRVSGNPASELETVHRTLRVRDQHVTAPVAQVARAARFTPPVAPAVTAPPKPASETDAVKERILALVSDKTGYPVDMLALDLDLEADLGVDTVKQAEVFASVRAAFNIPRDENLRLRDFPTLAHVIQFARDRSARVAEVSEPPLPAPAAVPAAAQISIQQRVLEIVAEKTGYPQEMLDLDLDLEADLGVDTVKQAEMFASVRAAFNIPRDENLKLRDFPTLSHVIQFARDRKPETATVAASMPVPVRPASRILASLEAVNSIPRRVPVPNLRPPLTMCKPTGVALGPGNRVVLMPDKSGVAEALAERLAKLGVEVLRIENARDADALASHTGSLLAARAGQRGKPSRYGPGFLA
jgi:hypothetical protein